MFSKLVLKMLFASAVALALALTPLRAQMVSAGMTGTVRDAAGTPVSGAAVTAVHTPTNTTYNAVSGANGRFAFRGMPVGGPYTVSASKGGFQIESLTDVQTSLGEDTDISLIAAEDVITLERLVTTASRSDLDASATGSSNVLSTQRIENQPTSTRSFADLMKTNPFVTIRTFPQVTALGMNYRYNSIMLDGARVNDQFGLASSGLLSLKNPFALDAIEQFSVSLTPYDVGQSGFAGAAVNAVSKSGTNEFHGSAYVLYTADDWQGRDVAGTNVGKRPVSFLERTQGMTFGGPIIRDRLFFFANYEKVFNPSGAAANAGFNPSSSFLSFLDAQIAALPGSPDLGDFGGGGATIESDIKRLLKLDWNINSDHRLTVRYSDTRGSRPNFGSFNPGAGFSGSVSIPGASNTGYSNGITSLSSSYYALTVIEKVWATQLFSNWTSNLKTQFNFSKNDSSSLRTTPAIFPEIRIFNVPGTANNTAATPISSANAITFGTELSSMGNGVITEGLSYSGNADYTWKDFTFKVGFDREETDFENLFRAGSYGVFAYNYTPTLNLTNDKPIGFGRSVAQGDFPGTDISRLEQTGYFAQAKWDPTRRFNMTLGLRYDVVGSPIAPPFNPNFSTAFNTLYPGVRNDGTIDGTSRLAPRVGFNYSLDDERKTQIRGGIGVFLGRNPWVWISNSYGNAGFGRFATLTTGANSPTLGQYLQGTFTNTDPAFSFDPDSPLGTTNTSPTSTSAVNVAFVEPGLQLPTNLRGNLAIDRKLPFLDATLTLEYIHNDAMEAMFYDNINLRVLNGSAQNQPTAASYGADGRLRFATNAAGTTGGTGVAPLVAGYGNVWRLRNVSAGESDYVSLMLDRPFKNGWAYNVAYTRGRSTDAQAAGSSTASSNWAFNIVFNQGAVEVERSDYEISDRFQLSVSKEFRFFGRMRSVFSLYYEGRSGQPYSYVYSGDLNRDGNSNNDVFAVPTGLDDARFDFSGLNTGERDAYFRFIEESGLEKYAGSYAPRNAFTTAWQNRLDLRFSQEVRVAGPVVVELFADFLNFGSWLNEDIFNYIETINTSTTNSNQFRALGTAAYTTTGLIRPTLTSVGGSTLDSKGNLQFASGSQIQANNADSKWRVQAGVRVKF